MFLIPFKIMKKRNKQKERNKKQLVMRAILYLREYSRNHHVVDWYILRVSMKIVRSSFKNCSIMYQKVNENAMNDLKDFTICFPFTHF